MLPCLPRNYPGPKRDALARNEVTRMKLTVKAVEAMASSTARREIADSLLPGLYLVVQPTGAKSWAVRCRHHGRSRKFTLGRYPLYGLAEARDAAIKLLRNISEGHDPTRRAAGSIDDLVRQFFDRYAKRRYRPNTFREADRIFRRVLTEWGGRKIGSITRADIRAFLDGVEAPIMANLFYKYLRKLFAWAVDQDIIETSPATGIKKPHVQRSRDRVLDDGELRRLWLAADKIGYPFGSVVKILALTGQRRGEVAGMRWDEIADSTWTLSANRTKNGKLHTVPLSRQATAIIDTLPRISEHFVFSFGAKPVVGFDGPKEAMGSLAGLADWRLHDLRRTVASGMARMGVALPVIEKVLNHTSGSFAGIVGVYQRHEFADEKRAALQQWADHVEHLVRPCIHQRRRVSGRDPRLRRRVSGRDQPSFPGGWRRQQRRNPHRHLLVSCE